MLNSISLGLLGILFFIGCSNSLKKKKEGISLEQISIKSRIPYKTVTYPNFIAGPKYIPCYLGQKHDIVSIDRDVLDSSYFYTNFSLYKTPEDSNDIRLFVDTTQYIPNNYNTITSVGIHSNWNEFKKIIFVKHKSYPVYIENISLDTLNIGSMNGLQIHLECLLTDGSWKKMNRVLPGCGTGLKLFKLPPKAISITAYPISNGSFTTKFRFAYGYNLNTDELSTPIYSNVFYSKIDSSFIQKKIPF